MVGKLIKKLSNMKMGGKINYTHLFYRHILFRHSCGECHYTNLHRPSDITIADYWGWQKTDPEFNADNKGCSLVLCNTEKGQKLFDAIKDRMNTIPAELPNVMQKHLSKPSAIHPRRMDFERYYIKGGFEYAARKTGMVGWRHTLDIVIKRIKKYGKK